MPSRKRLTVDRNHMLRMLSDPEFYQACPAFLWLQVAALESRQLYDASAAHSCCGGKWAIVKPVVDAFVEALQQFKKTAPAHVTAVRSYLEEKKGAQYDKIIIFYRSGRAKSALQRLTL